jgi:uncharacterized protein (TIGR02687 family)
MNNSTKDKIQQVLTNLIERKRLVFWYDEGGQMQEFVNSLELPGIEVLMLNHNAFTLKHLILTGEQPEKGFIIYSKESRPDDGNNWLLDLEVQAIPFSADMGSLYAAECGIAMELKQKVIDAHLEFFKTAGNRQKLTSKLHEGMDAPAIEKEMLAVVCRTEPNYDALTYALAKEALENKSDMIDCLKKYNLSDFYWNDVRTHFGYDKNKKLKDLLIVLFKNDMLHPVGGDTLTNEAHIFMRDWRDSRLYGDMYKAWSSLLEQELNIRETLQGYTLEQLLPIESFPCIDKLIAQHLQMEVANSTITVEQIESIVDEREHKIFFSVAAHTIKALLEARRLMKDIDQKMTGLIINSIEEGFKLYCNELYTIDLHYRHYFREARNAESVGLLASITEMIQRAYTNGYLMQLANKWQPMIDGLKKWQLNGIISQRNFYNYYVAPYVVKNNKLFVIISDALRYETMVELEQRIAGVSRMSTTMKPAMVSTLPSYTQLGMAALLPNSDLSYDKPVDIVFADGMSTQGTDSRGKVLKNKVLKSLAVTAENFLTITSPKTYFKDFDLVYIYSNVIDKTGDNKDTEGKVFSATEDEFTNILKIVDLIRNGNGSNILITSDHGYLFQNEELDESDFTDFKVIGNIIQDTRRFVIGTNLQEGVAVNTWNSEDVGLKEGVQIQTAKGMNRIRKQGSGSRFVHGGSMLQEIVVPVLHVNIQKKSDVSQVNVDILNKRSRLTTNNQTISFYQNEAVTEKMKGITLRLGFYDANKNLISDAVTLTFDSQSPDSVQREQRHIFMFKNQLSKLNGQEVVLKMEKEVTDSEQFTLYKEVSYKVSVMFQAEF